MEDSLKQIMQKFRDTTVKLLEELEGDNYDELENLLSKRQTQIDIIDSIEHSKEEFTDICIELQVLMLQEKLTKLMKMKRARVREELDDFNKGKTANISYRNKGSIDALYFNKKI